MQQNYGPASFRHGLRIQQFHIFQCHNGTGPQSNFQRLYMGGNALSRRACSTRCTTKEGTPQMEM